MKIHWGLRRKHAEVLADIDRLEHELGLATEQLLPARKTLPPPRGAVDLSHVRKRQMREIMLITGGALSQPQDFDFGPGAVIPVAPGGNVQFLAASSVASTAVRIVPRSRVELPPGVRLQ